LDYHGLNNQQMTFREHDNEAVTLRRTMREDPFFTSSEGFTMRFISTIIKHLEESAAERERQAQERYMADATDIYDVEARLREWDRLHSIDRDPYGWLTGQRVH
jgi:hypothetical protein